MENNDDKTVIYDFKESENGDFHQFQLTAT